MHHYVQQITNSDSQGHSIGIQTLTHLKIEQYLVESGDFENKLALINFYFLVLCSHMHPLICT